MAAPESFELDDVDGHARPSVEWVPDQHRTSVMDAAQSCPEQAIDVMIERLTNARAAHAQGSE